ncbi:shikimate 5-dehydrogenase [uncultured Cohaesibacter sp.]|uniref:shikimate 5-dehydrogenase n=1 Tax=uncultured Cohaesibacter sp. TaxID=1002546 RepID=UPI0029C71DE4|nr:shikimate 5-dehydrogenase [uncultured Cohaesibacter sp.]
MSSNEKPLIGPRTRLCMSLSARPSPFGTRFHNRMYELLGLDYVYKAFSTTDLPAAIGGVRALGIRGCAISMPFKEAVIPLLDAMEASAAAIDSVNTIVNDDGRLTGYNTDYIAIHDLLAAARIAPSLPFLLRGSGGMAKAVAAALRNSGFTKGTIIARNETTGRALAGLYGFDWAAGPEGLTAPLIINATPMGMAGPEAEMLAFDESVIDSADYVFDVVAMPAETPLMKVAERLGKTCISGAEVIVLQAVEQFALYTGVRPDRQIVEDASAFSRDVAKRELEAERQKA